MSETNEVQTQILFAISDLKSIVSANGATLKAIETNQNDIKETVAVQAAQIGTLKEFQDKQKGIGGLLWGTGALSGIVTAFVFKYLIH